MADTEVCAEKQCIASGPDGQIIYAPAGTIFTPGVPFAQPEHDLPWPFGLLVLAIAAVVLWHLSKTAWARLRSRRP